MRRAAAEGVGTGRCGAKPGLGCLVFSVCSAKGQSQMLGACCVWCRDASGSCSGVFVLRRMVRARKGPVLGGAGVVLQSETSRWARVVVGPCVAGRTLPGAGDGTCRYRSWLT
mmetsp:Transcript_24806/g.60167  ORF Transcript_24806/g.60167 Transcript_24806/m.60167 type:complete len:113 (-) Transcript_24806:31-369(-)